MEQQGRLDEALATWRGAIGDPAAAGEPLAVCLRRTAEVMERLGRFREAIDVYRQAAADLRTGEPAERRSDLLVHAARLLHRRLGRMAEAREALDEALALAADHPPALGALDAILAENEDTGGELQELERTLATLPLGDVAAHVELREQIGVRALQAGDLARARRHLERVLAEAPARTGAQRSMADLHLLSGEWAAGADALERLASLLERPADRADALFRAGEIHHQYLAAAEDAADDWLKAVDLDPGHTGASERLMDHYWTAGDLAGVLEFGGLLRARTPLTGLDPARVAHIAVAAAAADDPVQAACAVEALGSRAAAAVSDALAAAARLAGPPLLEKATRILDQLCRGASGPAKSQ
jgi:tetratricopeptide (TPR) repeat protein